MSPLLPALLRDAAHRHPDRIAVRDGAHALSYGDLLSSVHRLSHRLLDDGPLDGAWVGACLDRSVRAVVAQAAILAAGGVYVPLDPAAPPHVLRRMLEGVAPLRIVGAAEGLAACASVTASAVALDDPATAADLASRPTKAVPVDLGPSDPAYVIHTSGSTGVPKGVLVSHGAIAVSTEARWLRYPDPVTGFLMVSPMFFDSSLAGIWWTLGQGGLLELAPSDTAALIARVRQTLAAPSDISHTLLTPTVYGRALAGLEEPHSTLRCVIVAGEGCPDALVRRHHQLLPGMPLVNEYGPTEAAVWCTSTTLDAGEEVTIGTPLPDVELLVLNPQGGVLPEGDVGELAIAGAHLAEGYPADPALTRERFIPHPARPGERLYRTGDCAQLQPNGRYSLMGRLDEQVKIRGQRVDLAGVRRRLADHPGVAEAALALRDRSGGEGQILIAYVTPVVDRREAEREIREGWTKVVDEVATSAPQGASAFDTSGWNSSLTGRALPDADMTEWVDRTVQLLREGDPRSVLDLGCGSGLPLLRVAPHCRRYVALDVSEATLRSLRVAVERSGLGQVELRCGDASQVEAFSGGGFDLVVSNSVSQYFPDAEYLKGVIDGGLAAAAPGGRVVIGDVRDLDLLWEFHAAVSLARAGATTPAEELLRSVTHRVQQEAQLVVSPRWFLAHAQARGGVDVELRLRRGRHDNEMNAFRFDAVVRRSANVARVDVAEWREWSNDLNDAPHLRSVLTGSTHALGFRGVPNGRTAEIHAALTRLRAGWAGSRQDLQRQAKADAQNAVHPEWLADVAGACGAAIHFDRSRARPGGAFDVVFMRPSSGPGDARVELPRFAPTALAPDERETITDPVARRAVAGATSGLIGDLRRYAEETFPPQERPAAYVVLSALPMTRQGKLDVAALPAPQLDAHRSCPFVTPTTPMELAVARVWSSALGLTGVGVDDDFVELGGDSLMAASCAIQLGEELNLDLPAGAIFSAPTPRRLGQVLERTARRTGELGIALPSRTVGLPLTSAQTVFWFLDHYRRPGAARHPDFTLSVHYWISGPLEERALGAAIDHLVERHEALRTRVNLDASEGSQTVLEAEPGLLRVVHLDIEDADRALSGAARDDATRPLDPGAGRVFSAELNSAGPREHLLVLRIHHIVADGWSVDVIEEELEELYAAALSGRTPGLPPPVSYSRLTQQTDETFFDGLDWREDEPYRSALDYWRGQSLGLKPSLLTTSASTASGDTSQHSVTIPATALKDLLHQARRAGATLFSTVVGALAALRAQDTRDPDVHLLTLNAARDSAGVDRMVGLLLNPVLLRLDVRPHDTMSDTVRGAAERVREALAHGQVPLLAMCEDIPDLLTFMTQSQFVGVELLAPARGLHFAGCRIRRSDPFDDDFLGRRWVLPIELLLTIRRQGDAIGFTLFNDPGVVSDAQAQSLLARLRAKLIEHLVLETI